MVMFLFTYVVPKFAELFNSLDAKLPAVTVFMLSVGVATQKYFPFIATGLVLAVFLFLQWRKTDRGGDQILSTGATPLLLAAKVGDLEAIKLLLKYKPIIDLPNSTGVTPLMAAAGLGHSFNPTRGRFKTDEQAAESVKLLKDAGAEINGHDRSGMTALHSAAEHGWNDTVKLLVADGADLQPKDLKGLTPMDHAAGRHERFRHAVGERPQTLAAPGGEQHHLHASTSSSSLCNGASSR